jgi:hypothetical protein
MRVRRERKQRSLHPPLLPTYFKQSLPTEHDVISAPIQSLGSDAALPLSHYTLQTRLTPRLPHKGKEEEEQIRKEE